MLDEEWPYIKRVRPENSELHERLRVFRELAESPSREVILGNRLLPSPGQESCISLPKTYGQWLTTSFQPVERETGLELVLEDT